MLCRIKELSIGMNKQNELLSLIVQKMEIRTESNEKDGDDEDSGIQGQPGSNQGSRWMTAGLKQRLMCPLGVVNHWSRSIGDLRDKK